jgi:GGDEF domain-containing protein
MTLTATQSAMNSYARPRTDFQTWSGPETRWRGSPETSSWSGAKTYKTRPNARGVASRIDEAFGPAFVLTGIEISITASVGTAFAGPSEEASPLLPAEADESMYRAKRGQAQKPWDR